MRKVILLADDNSDDVLILQIAFRRATLPYDIYVVRDGEQVVQYLLGTGIYSDRQRFPFPDVLPLDLRMPIKSGFEVLEWLHERPEFSKIQTIVLSSSDDGRDIRRATDLGVGTFFVKSPQLQDVVQHLRGP
ncbi:MAG: response regulator [Limisphaerales bacterium]